MKKELIQPLWAGFGSLSRLFLENGRTVIEKKIVLPPKPNLQESSFAYERKLKSYQTELNWYKYNQINQPKIPKLISSDSTRLNYIIEDLCSLGYKMISKPSKSTVLDILKGLAEFHSNNESNYYWEQGGYWHLDTRPFEFERMQNMDLKIKAHDIDQALKDAKHQTIIHGDCKIANLLITDSGELGMVDFQYVGQGIGVKDLCTLFASIPDSLMEYQEEFIDFYFHSLSKTNIYSEELEEEWRGLYPIAWADYLRFLDGWE